MTSGGSRRRGCLHPADAIVCPVGELCWYVSRIKTTAAKAAALGRWCITHWGGRGVTRASSKDEWEVVCTEVPTAVVTDAGAGLTIG